MLKQCNLLFRMFTYFTVCFLAEQTLASLYIDALLNNVVICSQQLSNFNSTSICNLKPLLVNLSERGLSAFISCLPNW